MKLCSRLVLIGFILIVPGFLKAQTLSNKVSALHTVLDQLYKDMIPLCSQLIGVGRGIAGFAATWYIASRIWRHIANAEPVDFYPLFRPFVLGFAIIIFPSVLGMINGVMQPTVTGTAKMVKDSDKAIAVLLQKKEDAIKQTDTWKMYVGPTGAGDRDLWYRYTHPDDPTGAKQGILRSIGNDIKFAMAKSSYNFRNTIKEWMSEVLQIIYQAAGLCINTIRTFYMIVLAILGPLAFGIAVFDGFQQTLIIWIARYINIFLWLPVANIFGGILGKIQENMLKLDLNQIASNGDTFFSSTDSAYLIFMIIGIIGYFTIPGIANYIVHAGGSNALLYRVSNMVNSSTRSVVSGSSSMTRDAYHSVAGSMGAMGNVSPYRTEGNSSREGYLKSKLSGK